MASKKPIQWTWVLLVGLAIQVAVLWTVETEAKHRSKAKPKAAATVKAAEPEPAPASRSADEPVGWEKVGEDDGITSYTKEIAGDPVVALRGEGVVDASIALVASVILDDNRAEEWVDSLVESRRVKMYNDHEALEYNHIGTPFILKDREFLTRGTVEGDVKEKTITLRMRSVEDPAVPPTSYVRGELQGYWKMRAIENGAKTYVIAEMHADPKGSVPKWIVNLFQKGWAKGTLRSLRQQVAKGNIKVVPEVAKLFGMPGGLK